MSLNLITRLKRHLFVANDAIDRCTGASLMDEDERIDHVYILRQLEIAKEALEMAIHRVTDEMSEHVGA